MKGIRIFLLCGAVALPQLAMAGVSDTNPEGLGIVRAILSYCAQVDPHDAATFQQEWSTVMGGATGKQIDAIEETSGYKQGADMTISLLNALAKSDGAAKCAAGAARWGKAETTPGKGGDGDSKGGDGDSKGGDGKSKGGDSQSKAGDGESPADHWRAERPEPSSRFPFAPNAP
jgi:hypothetical protein